jgi:integrase
VDYRSIDKQLEKINSELKQRGCRIKVQRLEDSLWARGTFPPKAGETVPKQRRVPLGIKARLPNLITAKQQALELSTQLEFGTFVWIVNERIISNPIAICDWIAKLKEEYFKTRIDNRDTQLNWDKDYGYILAKLPQDKPLAADICERAILANYPIVEGKSPKQRNRMVMACGRLLDLAAIDSISLKRLRVDAEDAPIKLADIPKLEYLIECRDRLPVRWHYAYGLCAAYGLRPSEVWQCDTSELHVDRALIVNASKTNKCRFVYPYPPSLFDTLSLGDAPDIPTSNASSRKGRSAIMTRNFSRSDLGFTPYDLRHQFVYQMCLAGVPIETQCDMLGHSYAVHMRFYRLFIRSLARFREIRQANAIESAPPN